MRKGIYLAVALLLGIMFVAPVMAQEGSAADSQAMFMQEVSKAKTHYFEGTVLSHDILCKCFVLKTAKGNVQFQDDYVKFMDQYNRAKGLKIGAKVKGEYKVVQFINYAISINYVE